MLANGRVAYALFWPYAGFLDNGTPAGPFFAHECIEYRGSAACDVGPLVDKAFADVRYVQDLDELGIESLHYGLRCAGRGHDAVPERDVHALVAEFRERRYLRKQAVALATGCGQGPKLARYDEGEKRRRRIEHDGDAPGDEIDDRRAAATIGDVQELDRRKSLEQLAGEVGRAAGSSRRKGELPGVRLRERDHLSDRLRRQRRRDRHDQRQLGQQDDRCKILGRIIWQVCIKVRTDAVGCDRIQQQRVTVGVGLGDASGRCRPGSATAVCDDDRLPQSICKLRCDYPGYEVGRAARRYCDDELDRACRVSGLRTCRFRPEKSSEEEYKAQQDPRAGTRTVRL